MYAECKNSNPYHLFTDLRNLNAANQKCMVLMAKEPDALAEVRSFVVDLYHFGHGYEVSCICSLNESNLENFHFCYCNIFQVCSGSYLLSRSDHTNIM